MTALQIVQKFYPNVATVTDAKKETTIEVTKRDCQSKAVKNHSECALATACKRAMDLDGVVIAIRVAYLIKGNEAVRFGLGESIAREVTAFDRQGNFEPGEYTLLKPTHRIGDPASSGARKFKRGKSGRTVKHRHMTEDVRHIGDKP